MYAHWEGYFVHSTNAYLNFIADKKILISQLKDEFWSLTVRKRYKHNQINSDKNFSKFLLDIKSISDRSFKKGIFEKINGNSNLNSDILKFCCTTICIDHSNYADFFNFIDEDLIDRRNYIAHGSSLKFPPQEISEWRDKVVDLMRLTQTLIENAAVTASYCR